MPAFHGWPGRSARLHLAVIERDMGRWLQIAVLCLAAGASLAMEPKDWDAIRLEAMTMLSIFAAAVLFRLGRGVSSVSVDGLAVEEAESLAIAYGKVARRLAAMAGVTALGLVGLAGIGIVHRFISLNLPADVAEVVCKLPMALLAAVLALTLCRAVVLVRGDLSSVKIQGKSMVASVRRRHVEQTAAAIREAEKSQPFEMPSNYGELIENR